MLFNLDSIKQVTEMYFSRKHELISDLTKTFNINVLQTCDAQEYLCLFLEDKLIFKLAVLVYF